MRADKLGKYEIRVYEIVEDFKREQKHLVDYSYKQLRWEEIRAYREQMSWEPMRQKQLKLKPLKREWKRVNLNTLSEAQRHLEHLRSDH